MNDLIITRKTTREPFLTDDEWGDIEIALLSQIRERLKARKKRAKREAKRLKLANKQDPATIGQLKRLNERLAVVSKLIEELSK